MVQHTIDVRQHPRVNARLLVTYRTEENSRTSEASCSNNVSKGGMLLTTRRAFERGTQVAVSIKLPFIRNPVEVTGEVVASDGVPNATIYETRVFFTEADESALRGLGRSIGWRIREPQIRLMPNPPRSA